VWRLFLYGAALIALGASGTQATPPPVDSTDVVELPDTIVVTANRFGLTGANCVWPTALVPRQRLAQTATLSEALTIGSGVDLRDYSGTGSVSTLSNWGTFNRHMLLLYDGRVVRDYSLGGFNLSEYSPAEFDRVELLKGPQSAFYGSDALGGVVNLVPRSMLADKMEVSSQAGSFAYQRHRVSASRKVGQIGVGGWGELLRSDNARANAGVKADSYGLRTDFLSDNGRIRLHATARSFRDSLGSPGPMPAQGDAPTLGNEESSSLFDHQKDRNVSFDVQVAWAAGKSTDIEIDAYLDHKRLIYLSRFEESWNVPVDTAQTSTTYRKRSSGITGRIQREFSRATVAGGIDWMYGSLEYSSDQQSPFAPLPDRWNGGQHQLDIWSNVAGEITAGVRPDLSGRLSFVKGRDVQTSYNAGVVIPLSERSGLKIGYGFAYRIPSISDQFAQDAYTRGNPDLKAEWTRSIAATLSYAAPDRQLRAHLTGFSQRIRDLIQYQYDGTLYQYVPKNVHRFSSVGLDAGLRIEVTSKLSGEWSGVWQHARQTVDTTLSYVDAYYVPDLTWTLAAEYDLSNQVSWSADLRYVSNRWIQMYGGDGKTIDKVYEVGVRLSARLNGHLDLSAAVEDLTNEKRPSSFGFTLTDRDYPSSGRRAVVRLTIRAGR
jgi:vitamin B12 transporter